MSMTKPSKLSIIALESMVGAKASAIEVQYNPKEMSVDKSVPWSKHKDSKSDHPHLEFIGADGRTMSFEVMFDTYEEDTNVQGKVEIIQRMAMVRNPAESAPEDEKRPSRIKVVWSGGLPPFEGVLESVGTKYTMFSPKGFPVRANLTLKFKEASRTSMKKGG